MMGDYQVRFRERFRVKLPLPTRQKLSNLKQLHKGWGEIRYDNGFWVKCGKIRWGTGKRRVTTQKKGNSPHCYPLN